MWFVIRPKARTVYACRRKEEMLMRVPFNHYSQWYHFFVETGKLDGLALGDGARMAFRNFIYDKVVAHRVPDEFFTKGKRSEERRVGKECRSGRWTYYWRER